MTEPPIITLLTDFGADSPYVAQMKGAILSICRQAGIVDLTHSIPPQNVALATRRWREAIKHFPSDSIHVAVVDPGVGTDRRIVAVQSERGTFIAPDNGLLSFIDPANDRCKIHALTNTAFHAAIVSATFHGRDVMGPVAAHLANGVAIDVLGDQIDVKSLVRLELNAPVFHGDELIGEVIDVDSFGNLITQIQRSHIAADRRIIKVRISGAGNFSMESTYGNSPPGNIIALFGSSDFLEIACVNGNAQQVLQVEPGVRVSVTTTRRD